MNNGIPTHVAIIMDGNGRWATRQGLKTSDDVEKFLAEYKQKTKAVKELEKKTTNYNNYQKRDYTDLNNLYSNKKAE